MRRKTNPDGSIFYPESDGQQPISDNTRQFHWILILAGNLATLFYDRDDVFVGGNHYWYPVQGEPTIRQAPDVYVVFGRPKAERPSYVQWEEDGIPMTVVFEVLSQFDTYIEMEAKLEFYDQYGAEEYYFYDPESNILHGYTRSSDMLLRVRQMNGFVSPRLGIRFDLSGPELVVRHPDGRPFLAMEELDREYQKENGGAIEAEQRAARLVELSRKLLQQQATREELRELQRLVQPAAPSS